MCRRLRERSWGYLGQFSDCVLYFELGALCFGNWNRRNVLTFLNAEVTKYKAPGTKYNAKS
jgi:hypothetical protein